MSIEDFDLGRLCNAHVLSIGDAVVDRFIYGSAKRISPEAPVPVLKIDRVSTMPGGVGNVGRNLSSVGVQCTLVAVVGQDAAGDELSAMLGALPKMSEHLFRAEDRPTIVKSRYIASGQQLLRVDEETTTPIPDALGRDIVTDALACLKSVDVVIMSDYGKGLMRPEIFDPIVAAAAKAGIPVIVDPKGRDYSRYAGATIVTPNIAEIYEATGILATDDDEAVRAARALMAEVDIACVLLTRSEHGMSVVPRDGEAVHLPAMVREVFDVSGAGDTVVALLAAGIGAGLSIVDAAILANHAAGIVVGKIGTAVVEPDELESAIRQKQLAEVTAKIVPHDEISAFVEQWHGQGLKVGFTNGCFDLLHPGHVSLLRQAASTCDRLVVGLNSDASVKRLKGPQRPIQDELSRALVLSALRDVDAVVIFGEDTPIELIKAVRPDVLVKGADYAINEVVGGDFVQSYGGRVALAELVPNQSTSNFVGRIKAPTA